MNLTAFSPARRFLYREPSIISAAEIYIIAQSAEGWKSTTPNSEANKTLIDSVIQSTLLIN